MAKHEYEKNKKEKMENTKIYNTQNNRKKATPKKKTTKQGEKDKTKKINTDEVNKKSKNGKKGKKVRKHPKLMLALKIFIIIFLLLCVIGAGVIAAIFFGVFGDDFEITKEELKIGASNSKIVDKDGNVIQERNVVYGTWEPLVDEETWWKAQEILKTRSEEYNITKDGKTIRQNWGRRQSVDAYANKGYCSCGYTLTHVLRHKATDERYSQYAYECRWQKNSGTESYRKKHGLKPSDCTCKLPAVTDVAMKLMSVKVFKYLLTDIRDTIEDTIRIIEMANEQALVNLTNSGVALEELEATLDKLNNRLSRFADMYADGDLTKEQYRAKKESTENEIKHTDELIKSRKLAISEQKKKKLDVASIKERLNTFVDLNGYGVSNEMIEFFVERIIHRDNNEFVWELNLTGQPSKPNKYKIKEYSKEYSDSLKDDSNFNIIKTFVISLDECKEFCETMAHRQFKGAYWSQITVKIAVK